MKIEREFDHSFKNGTYKQGELSLPFAVLQNWLGNPDAGTADGKTDAEWVLIIDGFEIVTIHNWKNGTAYLGPEGLELSQMTEWTVGGHRDNAVSALGEALDAAGITHTLKTL